MTQIKRLGLIRGNQIYTRRGGRVGWHSLKLRKDGFPVISQYNSMPNQGIGMFYTNKYGETKKLIGIEKGRQVIRKWVEGKNSFLHLVKITELARARAKAEAQQVPKVEKHAKYIRVPPPVPKEVPEAPPVPPEPKTPVAPLPITRLPRKDIRTPAKRIAIPEKLIDIELEEEKEEIKKPEKEMKRPVSPRRFRKEEEKEFEMCGRLIEDLYDLNRQINQIYDRQVGKLKKYLEDQEEVNQDVLYTLASNYQRYLCLDVKKYVWKIDRILTQKEMFRLITNNKLGKERKLFREKAKEFKESCQQRFDDIKDLAKLEELCRYFNCKTCHIKPGPPQPFGMDEDCLLNFIQKLDTPCRRERHQITTKD